MPSSSSMHMCMLQLSEKKNPPLQTDLVEVLINYDFSDRSGNLHYSKPSFAETFLFPFLRFFFFHFFFLEGGAPSSLLQGQKKPLHLAGRRRQGSRDRDAKDIALLLTILEIYRPGNSGPASLCIVVLLRPSPPAVFVQTTIGKLVLIPTGRSHRSLSHLVVQHQLYFSLALPCLFPFASCENW